MRKRRSFQFRRCFPREGAIGGKLNPGRVVIGLHHLALRVENVEKLQSFYQTLSNTAGVEIEFAPEPLGGGPTQHMMFSIPGGIRMELTAPAS